MNTSKLSYSQSLWGHSQELLTGNNSGLTGWNITDCELILGQGEECFSLAVQRLFSWKAHRYAGVHVVESDSIVELKFWGTRSYCKILKRVETPHRALLIYGTLAQHVECGEETFEVSIDRNGEVKAHIVAFSKPARWWARWGQFIVRVIQLRITAKYLKGLKA